ncbi:hypothetical protein O9992_21035 [Vibrio lentus]|nr:hypothetical protein [Vibrio lentus]
MFYITGNTGFLVIVSVTSCTWAISGQNYLVWSSCIISFSQPGILRVCKSLKTDDQVVISCIKMRTFNKPQNSSNSKNGASRNTKPVISKRPNRRCKTFLAKMLAANRANAHKQSRRKYDQAIKEYQRILESKPRNMRRLCEEEPEIVEQAQKQQRNSNSNSATATATATARRF